VSQHHRQGFSRFDLGDREDILTDRNFSSKRGYSVFWWWLCSEVLQCFGRPLEKFERPKWSQLPLTHDCHYKACDDILKTKMAILIYMTNETGVLGHGC